MLDLKSSSEQIFSENWRWVPLIIDIATFVSQSVIRFESNDINSSKAVETISHC